MDEEEAKVDEAWSGLDSESRERAITLFLEIAYRFVVSQKPELDEGETKKHEE